MNQRHSTGVYAYFDGDDVGANIELHLLENDAEGAALVSERVSHAVAWLSTHLQQDFGARIVFAAGDEVLAFMPGAPFLEEIDLARAEFELRAQLSVSCGLGETPQEAAFQLRVAKLRGKNRLQARAHG